MSLRNSQFRSAARRVRGLGAAGSGTGHFIGSRVTSVALLFLSIAFVAVVVGLLGRNHAAVVQILGSPLVAILLLLFIVNSIYHMWLGMQVIIEDYVHDDVPKLSCLMANTFFCAAAALASVYAILKLSFGV